MKCPKSGGGTNPATRFGIDPSGVIKARVVIGDDAYSPALVGEHRIALGVMAAGTSQGVLVQDP